MKPVKSPDRLALVVLAAVALGLTGGGVAEARPDESETKPSSDEGHEEATKYVPRWTKWQKDIVQFNAMLGKLVETAEIPKKEEFQKRIESESGWVEVVTDGYGGVVDFNPAKGTIQHDANQWIGSGGPYIDWEIELAEDTKISYDKSTSFVPKAAKIADDGEGKEEQFRFRISLEKTAAGPFKAGDRIRLQASIDDFSRFKKQFSKATGLVAIYYLEDAPNPVFTLNLDEAEVTLLNTQNGEPQK